MCVFGFCFFLFFLTVQLSIILWLHYTALSCRLPSYQASTARIAYIPPKMLSTVTCLDQKMSERNKEHKVERIRCQHSFSSVQSLSRVWLFANPWIAERQASLSITNSRSSPRLTSIESVMPSSHLILCCPLLLLPPIPPSVRVFSNESALRMRRPKYWSFSFSIIPSKEIPGLISFRMNWLDHISKIAYSASTLARRKAREGGGGEGLEKKDWVSRVSSLSSPAACRTVNTQISLDDCKLPAGLPQKQPCDDGELGCSPGSWRQKKKKKMHTLSIVMRYAWKSRGGRRFRNLVLALHFISSS